MAVQLLQRLSSKPFEKIIQCLYPGGETNRVRLLISLFLMSSPYGLQLMLLRDSIISS
jgi:hypothetical protein